MVQVILTALAPQLSGFTVSPCSGISALREDWLLVGTVERNKQKCGSFKSHVALETTNLRYTMWLIGTFPREKSHDLLPSVAIHRWAPSHRKLSGSSGSCRWPRHLLTSWKKTHGMNQWWTDPKWQNHGIYWWYSLWQSMTLFCTSSVKISYDLQVSWSLSQANYQIASSPGSKDSLKQTHGDLDSRTLMTCSHVESFSIRQKDAIGIYQTNQVLHKVTSLSVWHRSIRGASAQPTGKLCIAGLLKEVDWYYNPCFPEERHSQGLSWFKYSTV